MTTALVTGSSSGIGKSAAIQIAKHGTRVIVTHYNDEERALETVGQIQNNGGTAVALPLDVSKTETFPAFKEAVTQVLAGWGADSLTYLANNAGISKMVMFEDTDEELFDRDFRVILKGPYFLTQTLLPLLEDGGAIVNTTSNSALIHGTEEGYSAYASMKGGLVVLTRYLAKELSKRRIRVNSVAPGPTRTRIADDAFGKHPEVAAPLAARTALGRVGEPDDLGLVIAWLLSEDSHWITAQNIEASGGFDL